MRGSSGSTARPVSTFAAVLVIGWLVLACGAVAAQAPRAWLESFVLQPDKLATAGENRYFILKPGYQLTLEGTEDGKAVRLVVTVLDETKTVGGVDTRVVEERESRDGALAEVSRNYMAIETGTNNVYYFGEDVDVYRNGEVSSHEGAWLHGTNGARAGLMMPGTATVGLRYYQELAPKVAMDRAEVVSVSERLATPAGTFDGCLKTEETTPLESGREYKMYAPGVGLVQDGSLRLTVVRHPPGFQR